MTLSTDEVVRRLADGAQLADVLRDALPQAERELLRRAAFARRLDADVIAALQWDVAAGERLTLAEPGRRLVRGGAARRRLPPA